jgi:hypothetical protein
MNEYAIKTTKTWPGVLAGGVYVAKGFGTQGTIKVTDRFPLVRTFKTRKAAEKFFSLRSYEICGSEIVPAPSIFS